MLTHHPLPPDRAAAEVLRIHRHTQLSLLSMREELNIDQAELATISGISRQTISAIETNEDHDWKINTLLRLVHALYGQVDFRISIRPDYISSHRR